MSDYFLNGTYTGNDGITYRVAKLAEWASDPVVIESGASRLYIVKLVGLRHGVCDETPGSPEFIKRMEAATLSDPLIVTKDFYIVDGVHRYYKARREYRPELMAYVVDANHFPSSARVSCEK